MKISIRLPLHDLSNMDLPVNRKSKTANLRPSRHARFTFPFVASPISPQIRIHDYSENTSSRLFRIFARTVSLQPFRKTKIGGPPYGASENFFRRQKRSTPYPDRQTFARVAKLEARLDTRFIFSFGEPPTAHTTLILTICCYTYTYMYNLR